MSWFSSKISMLVSRQCSRLIRRSNVQKTSSRRWKSGSPKPSSTEEIRIPTAQQLRIVAFRAAIPMVGFGIMDNFVMITAGEAIDQTFGVALGISTMAAAGFGQCASDVAGITSGGIVDAAVSKLNLPQHGLSQYQLGLKVSRVYSTFGACCGVLTGCLLGMSVLLFMDTERADRMKKAKELNSIFETITEQGHNLLGADRATLFMFDEEKKELWSRVGTGIDEDIIKVPVDQGIVGQCVSQMKSVVNVPDAYKDPHFNEEVDKKTGFHTGSVLVAPVWADDKEKKEILGAIQIINKRNPDGSMGHFSKSDEDIVQVLANHVTSFIRIVDA